MVSFRPHAPFMKLAHGLHLAYCTNIHRGETWLETFAMLQRHTLAVRERVAPGQPFAIGLRLSDQASRQLADPPALRAFREWLDEHHAYVFTINGFPYGSFHGTRVKEQVYVPDWTAPERLAYTNRLFDLLGELAPAEAGGSVSTVPVSFKAFGLDAAGQAQARAHVWQAIEHIEAVSRRTGKDLHLGLEPEPLCFLETTAETTAFFEALRRDRPGDDRWQRYLGVNYDCCHLAIEFEEPGAALARLREAGIRISKLHLSNALRVQPTPEVLTELQGWQDAVYLHQVVARDAAGTIQRFRDLPEACREPSVGGAPRTGEWRIHFHIPLHALPARLFSTTADHALAVLDQLGAAPAWCRHLEMETYTWEVLPATLKNRSVEDQLVGEYEWTLGQLAQRGLARI